jgi:hypothetical protein
LVFGTKRQKTGGVLLFKAHQEPKSMQGIAKQFPVVVEAKEIFFKVHSPHWQRGVGGDLASLPFCFLKWTT